jgi:hypothetical protein
MKQLIFIAMIVFLSTSITLAQDFCKGDFNYNGNVAAEDVEIFLAHFGRSQFNNPCPSDGPAPVPKTWQTTSYGTGDDGDLRRGVAWPDLRWTDNGDGTVTDHLTGLIWLKNANCFGQRIWNNALVDCNGISSGWCGLTDGSNAGDWRLPSIRELQSHIDYDVYDPAIWITHPYVNVQLDLYWSSTTFTSDTDNAWVVALDIGGVYFFNKQPTGIYVWPVRGGY